MFLAAADNAYDFGAPGATRPRNGYFGTSLIQGGLLGLATTSTDGVVLQNTTASTAGVPVQMSPRLRLRGNVWNTTVTAANNTDDWFIEGLPVSGATPSSILKFGSSLNGAAGTYPMTLTNAGQLSLLAGVTYVGDLISNGVSTVVYPSITTGSASLFGGSTGGASLVAYGSTHATKASVVEITSGNVIAATFSATQTLTLASLAGAGTRTVVADANGVLSAP